MRRLMTVTVLLLVPSMQTAEARQIVGGRPASRPYSWMASLQTNGGHFCGGSLVRPNWILTAKHCVSGRAPGSFQIMLGSQVLSQPGQIHQTAQVIVDPAGASDSAVVRLATPSTLEPIRIGMPSESARWAPGTKALATGWGTNFFLVGPSPDQLEEVELPIVSDADCGTLNGPAVGFNGAYEVCAGEQTGGKDTCQGDSGGPLMVPDARGRLIVIGSTWKGLGCGFPLFYGSYASVAENPINAWLRTVLPPESALSVGDASANESTSAIAFTVRKTGTTATQSRVNFTTVDGTAVAGSDYWPLSGTLVFEPDDTTQTIFVPIMGDGVAEGAEAFTVQLSGAVDASITVGVATGTIADDD